MIVNRRLRSSGHIYVRERKEKMLYFYIRPGGGVTLFPGAFLFQLLSCSHARNRYLSISSPLSHTHIEGENFCRHQAVTMQGRKREGRQTNEGRQQTQRIDDAAVRQTDMYEMAIE